MAFMLLFRRLVLIALCLVVPPLLAIGFYEGGQYYLTVSHKFLDPQLQRYAFYFELVFFYLGSAMELRSRWAPVEE